MAIRRQLRVNRYRTTLLMLPSPTLPQSPFHLVANPSFRLLRPPDLGLTHTSILSLTSSDVPVSLQNASQQGRLLSTFPEMSQPTPSFAWIIAMNSQSISGPPHSCLRNLVKMQIRSQPLSVQDPLSKTPGDLPFLTAPPPHPANASAPPSPCPVDHLSSHIISLPSLQHLRYTLASGPLYLLFPLL